MGWLQRRKIFFIECVADKFLIKSMPVSVSENTSRLYCPRRGKFPLFYSSIFALISAEEGRTS